MVAVSPEHGPSSDAVFRPSDMDTETVPLWAAGNYVMTSSGLDVSTSGLLLSATAWTAHRDIQKVYNGLSKFRRFDTTEAHT